MLLYRITGRYSLSEAEEGVLRDTKASRKNLIEVKTKNQIDDGAGVETPEGGGDLSPLH